MDKGSVERNVCLTSYPTWTELTQALWEQERTCSEMALLSSAILDALIYAIGNLYSSSPYSSYSWAQMIDSFCGKELKQTWP